MAYRCLRSRRGPGSSAPTHLALLSLGILLLAAPASAQDPAPPAPAAAEPPRYVGVAGCRDCHATRGLGDQVSPWRKSAHSRAWRDLTTDRAREIGAKQGVAAPSEDERCLRCHATGREAGLDRFARAFRVEDGVQCEACHGPGSEYRPRDAMKDPRRAAALGLLARPGEAVCTRCHNSASPTFAGFDFAAAANRIAHPLAPKTAFVPDHAVAWDDRLDQATRAADERHLPLWIDYHPGRGCPRCEEMATVLADPRVVAAAQRVVPVRVEDPTQEELLRVGLPDCAERLQTAGGQVVKDLLGVVPPEVMAHALARGGEACAPDGPAPDGGPGAAAVAHAFEMLASLGDRYRPTAERKLLAAGPGALAALGRAVWSLDSGRRQFALDLLASTLVRRWEEWRARQVAWEVAPAVGPPGPPAPLEPLPESVVLDLLAFAYDPDLALRALATDGLGATLDPRVTGTLVRYLVRDPDPNVSRAAYRSLGRLRDPACVGPMLALVADPPCGNPTCPCRIDSLTVIYGLAGAREVPALVELLGDRFVAAPVVAVLGEARSPDALEPLGRLLADRKQPFAVRNEVIYAVEKILPRILAGHPELLAHHGAALAAQLDDPNVEIRAGILEGLGLLGYGSGVINRMALLDPDPIARAYAGRSIGLAHGLQTDDRDPANGPWYHGESFVLHLLANEPTALPRNLALEAYWQAGRADTTVLLREALKDVQGKKTEDRKALAEAARALERACDLESVPLLQKLLDDEDLDTSRVAGAWLDALTLRLGKTPCVAAGVPVDLPRILYAGVGGTLVDGERARILDRTRELIAAYREQTLQLVRPEKPEPPWPSGPRAPRVEVTAVKAQLFERDGKGKWSGQRQRLIRLSLSVAYETRRENLAARLRVFRAGLDAPVYQVHLTPAVWLVDEGWGTGGHRAAAWDPAIDERMGSIWRDGQDLLIQMAVSPGPLPPLPAGDLVVELLGSTGPLRVICEQPK